MAKKKKLKPAPLAPKKLAKLPPIEGVELGVAEAGVRYQGRTDVMLAHMRGGAAVAGVFTTSKTAAAPVEWCRDALARGRNAEGGARARALIVNSGNANAFTGRAGGQAVKETVQALAQRVKCRQRDVFVASTGVIGEALPAERVTAALDELVEGAKPKGWRGAARAIMTTDTFPKLATRSAIIDGHEVRLNGIAKGSGMIAPDMATMLAFIFTDAKLPDHVLQALLTLGVRDTFNAITVDSDTSTSDTVLLFATGAAGPERAINRAGDARLRGFREALHDLMRDLAHQIVRDGEGARKFVTVRVSGAASTVAARRIAFAIANSPLVKTAIAGEDPNWGRIVMAVGKAGEAADRDKLEIRFGDILVAREGVVDPDYREEDGAAVMRESEIEIAVDVGVGRGEATVWTCDLTKRYVAINADYRS